MNNYSQLQKNYQRTRIETASPGELVVILYDGAINALNQACLHIQAKNIEGSHVALVKAEAIINELRSTLNMEAGGQIAKNLFSLYTYMHGRLVDANFKKDEAPVREVIKLMTPLRDAWAEISKTAGPSASDAEHRTSAFSVQR